MDACYELGVTLGPRSRVVAANLVSVCLLAGACASDESAESRAPTASTTTGSTTSTSIATTSAPTSSTTTAPVPTTPPGFEAKIDVIDEAVARRMSSSWRAGCPVELRDLRFLAVTHLDFDGQTQAGELVVHAAVADDIVDVFRMLFEARFPIEQIRLVDEFGGDDNRSMAANNTSAFNCRKATASSRWSEHAFGKAIDINPVQNPYVTRSGAVLPPAGGPFVERDPAVPGLIVENGPVVRGFDAIGWGWGGRWSSDKDYQHFSAGGR